MQTMKPHTHTPLTLSLPKFYHSVLILETWKMKTSLPKRRKRRIQDSKVFKGKEPLKKKERKQQRNLNCCSKNKLAVTLPSVVLVNLIPPPSVSKDASEETKTKQNKTNLLSDLSKPIQ